MIIVSKYGVRLRAERFIILILCKWLSRCVERVFLNNGMNVSFVTSYVY